MIPVLSEDNDLCEKDGVVLIRQVFDAHWIETLRTGFKLDPAKSGPIRQPEIPED
jgi:hypothetical protein